MILPTGMVLQQIIGLLYEHGRLENGALIYIEAERELGEIKLPPGWRYLKQKKAGQIEYFLVANNKEG